MASVPWAMTSCRAPQRREGLGGPVHQPAQAGQFRRVPHFALEALPQVVHGHARPRPRPRPTGRAGGGPWLRCSARPRRPPPGSAWRRRRRWPCTGRGSRAPSRGPEGGRGPRDRRRVLCTARVGAARDQQQRDRDQVAESRDEDGPAGKRGHGRKIDRTQATKTARLAQ